MNIVVFTNGNVDIGFGHISRTLNVANYLKKIGSTVKFCVPEECTYKNQISDYSFEVIVLKTFSETQESIDKFRKCCDTVIIDTVEKDYRSLEWLSRLNLFIVSITLFDFSNLNRYENISFYPTIKPTKVDIQGDVEVFSGRDYLTFNPLFENYINLNHREKAKKVLLTMGGTDPFGLTLRVLNSIKDLSDFNFTILLSENSPSYSQVKLIVDKHSHLTLLSFVLDMPKRMAESDLIILNGGLTRYESCLVGTPFVAISIHQVQFEITKELTDLVGAINLGVFNEIDDNLIKSSLLAILLDSNKRKSIALKMRSLLDVKGIERICRIIDDKYLEYYEKTDKAR